MKTSNAESDPLCFSAKLSGKSVLDSPKGHDTVQGAIHALYHADFHRQMFPLGWMQTVL